MPSAKAISSGNAKTQNTASGSRRNSRSRTMVSSTIGIRRGSRIAQVPAGEVHEHVFERRVCVVRKASFRPAIAEQVEQRRQREVRSPRRPARRSRACTRTSRTPGSGAQLVRIGQRLAVDLANSTTCSPPSERISSRGVPSAITLPWSTTATRSHSRSASSM